MVLALFERMANLDCCSRQLRREFLELHARPSKYLKADIAVDEKAGMEEFLRAVYQQGDGLLIGEEHFDAISLHFLTEQLPYLASLGVDTLFFEGLFFGLERGADGAQDEKERCHIEYGRLIDAAKAAGLRVVGLDAKGCKRGQGITRDIFMNAYAQSIINHLPERGKWVALVGKMHLHGCHYVDPQHFMRFPVQGLAEFTGSPSLVLQSGEYSLRRNVRYKAAPALWLDADFQLSLPQHKAVYREKPSSSNPVEVLADKLARSGAALTHFDIDDVTFDTGEYVIFGFTFLNLGSNQVQAVRYRLARDIAVISSHTAVHVAGKELLFRVPQEEVGLVTQCIAANVAEVEHISK